MTPFEEFGTKMAAGEHFTWDAAHRQEEQSW